MKKIYTIINLFLIFISLNALAVEHGNTTPPPNCNAQFSYSVDTNNSLLIHFTDLSIGNLTNWNWDFGDGSTSNNINPSHTYASAGSYSVILSVNDSGFTCFDSVSVLINVTNTSPSCQANFTQLPDSTNSQLINFTDLSTGNIIIWYWDFGDGSNSSTTNPSHYYTTAGNYSVTLTVSDSLGTCYDSIVKNITVNANQPQCQANFSYNISTSNNLSVTFTDQSTGYPYAWLWDFGDGYYSNSQHPSHTYAAAGNYTVKLEITTQSCTDSTQQQIIIQPNQNTGSLLVYVYADSSYLDSGQVFLYQHDSITGSFNKVDSSFSTFNQGVIYYNFANIPQGIYYVYAQISPNASTYNSFYNTWAPNQFSWQTASPILVNSHNIWTTIFLKKNTVTYPSGNGSIAGQVLDKANGNIAVEGVDVFLLLNDSSIISKVTTNQQGAYEFSSLGFGSYLIHPEIIGKYTINKLVNINFDQPIVDTIVFVIDGNKIVTGINQTTPNTTQFGLYPNPFHNTITISSNANINHAVKIDIRDLSGRLLYESILNFDLNHKKNIDLSQLSNGLYFITISGNDFQITKKIIKR